MKKLVGLALVACLAAPAAGLAKKPPQPGRSASASCKAQLAAMGSANFRSVYGNLGRCVSQMAKTSAGQGQELVSAAKRCKAEQGSSDASRAAFKAKYGTNGKPGTPGYRSNAFGKCVSAAARKQNDDGDQESAARAHGDFTFSAGGIANRHVVFDVRAPARRSTFLYSDGTTSYTARVDCVLIAGSSVTLGGLVQNATGFDPGLPVPTYLVARAVDNGASGDGYNALFLASDPCPGGLDLAAPGGLFPITSGSITVGH